MAGGAVAMVSNGTPRVEAPVTFKAYLMCAFAAFGGIFFGYDSGYINGVTSMTYFIETFQHLVGTALPPNTVADRSDPDL
jgi:hypothetical protein